MRLDFITPTKGRHADLISGLRKLQELHSLECPDGLEIGICISDSSENPLSPALFSEICPDIRVTYVHSPQAKSFTENIQLAIGLSKADYGWLMGDDDYLLPGALEEAGRLLLLGPTLIHANAVLLDSHQGTQTRLIQETNHENELVFDIPHRRTVEELTYMSCLIFRIDYIQDASTWQAAHPAECSIQLRCLCRAVAGGQALATPRPLVAIEKNAAVVGELAGLWCILLGYEIPRTRDSFLRIQRKKDKPGRLRKRAPRAVIQEVRMHLTLAIFRGSYPRLAIEAAEFLHEYPTVRFVKKLITILTTPKSARDLARWLGQLIDRRCLQLKS